MWVALGLLAALLYATVNLLDKHLLNNVLPETPVTVLLVLAGAAGTPFIVGLGIAAWPELAAYTWRSALGGTVAGLLAMAATYVYFHAVSQAAAAVVATLWQLAVVFNLVLGWFVLGEHLDAVELAGMSLVVCASVAITIELGGRRARLDWRTLSLMTLVSLMVSCSGVLFKKVALGTSYLSAQFFIYLAGGLVAVGLLSAHCDTRRAVLRLRSREYRRTVWLAAGNETMNLTAAMANGYALVLGPVALVQAVVGLQNA